MFVRGRKSLIFGQENSITPTDLVFYLLRYCDGQLPISLHKHTTWPGCEVETFLYSFQIDNGLRHNLIRIVISIGVI